MTFPVYAIDNALPLRNEAYYLYLSDAVKRARERFWSAAFIINPSTTFDKELTVRSFLKDLAKAVWRNVDVKVLIGNATTPSIAIPNEVAARYMERLGIDTRIFVPDRHNYSLHSKYSIIDDHTVVIGSSNWSPGGFGGHIEDSIAVASKDLNTLLSQSFLHNWNQSKP